MKPHDPAKHASDVIYKICSLNDWKSLENEGRWGGSSDDIRDGYIHFSSRAQLEGTFRKHFSGKPDLMILEIATNSLGASLRWEPSRGGDLFPHLYTELLRSFVQNHAAINDWASLQQALSGWSRE